MNKVATFSRSLLLLVVSVIALDAGAQIVNPAFLQEGAGAVARPLLSKLLDIPASLRDFGAKCDGVTDDSAALLKAVNALGTNTSSAANGRILKVPRGKCTVASQFAITSIANIIVEGEGGTFVQGFKEPASKIVYTGTASPFLSFTTNYSRGWQFRNVGLEYSNPSFAGTLIDIRTPGIGFYDVTIKGSGVTASMSDLYSAQYLVTVSGYEILTFQRVTFANAKKHLRVEGMDSGPLNIVDCVFYTATERFIEVDVAGNFGVNLHRNFFDVSIDSSGAQISGDGIIIKSNGFSILGNMFSGYVTRAPSGAYLVVSGAGGVRDNTFRTNFTAVRADSVTLDFSGNFVFAKLPLDIRASATVVRGGGNTYSGANSPSYAVDIARSYTSGYATVELGLDSINNSFPVSYNVNLPGGSGSYQNVNGVIRYSPSTDSSTNGPVLNASVRLENIAPTDLAKTADYTITYRDCGRVLSNSGATSAVVFTLPAARIGCRLTFLKAANQNITINRVGSDSILLLNSAASSTSNTAASNQYAEITLQGHYNVGGGQVFWRVENMRGTWSKLEPGLLLPETMRRQMAANDARFERAARDA